MKWQCALLQRWLPEYPDGDLPAVGRRWLKFHVARCSACRRELVELWETVDVIKATPVAEPGPEFWRDFSRDMHLKLVQAAQESPGAPAASPRRFRLPYLLGAPALAVLLLYVAVYRTGPGVPLQDQAVVKLEQKAAAKMAAVPGKQEASPARARPSSLEGQDAAAKMAAVPQPAPAPSAEVAAAPPLPMEQFVTVALEEGAPLPEEEVDISGWDLDAELAGMTDQEKTAFLNKMHQRKKDGSCAEGLSFSSWG